MINPDHITNFAADDATLEATLCFAISAAGKTAKQQAAKMSDFYAPYKEKGLSPLDAVEFMIKEGTLLTELQRARVGMYNQRMIPALTGILNLDLRTVTWQELMKVHGIGPKTAILFVLHTRPKQRIAALDTHILKELREQGYAFAPLATPSWGKDGAEYLKWQEIVCGLAEVWAIKEYGEITDGCYAEYDLSTWQKWRDKAEKGETRKKGKKIPPTPATLSL